ncbi:cupin domain-containing protein [Massilia sp. SR12]
MKTFTATLAVFAMFAAQSAYALDQSASVKVNPLLKSTTSWNGAQLAWPAGQAEVTALQIEIAAGAETGWHMHPVPSFAYVLEGELEVSLKDGAVRRFVAGQALAEVVGTMHNGRNVGAGLVKLVVFYVGASNSTLTIKQ